MSYGLFFAAVVFVVLFDQVGSSMGLWLGLGVAQAFSVAVNFLFDKRATCRCQ